MFEKIRTALNERDVFAKSLGITVHEIRQGYARASMTHAPNLCNSMGNLHGGASFSLADMAFAGVAISSGITTVNITSSVNFVSPGRKGPYIAEAKLVSESRKLCTIEVSVKDANGELVATMLGTGFKTGKAYLGDESA